MITYFLRSVRSQAKERKERRKKTRRRSRKNKKKHWVKKKKKMKKKKKKKKKQEETTSITLRVWNTCTHNRVQSATQNNKQSFLPRTIAAGNHLDASVVSSVSTSSSSSSRSCGNPCTGQISTTENANRRHQKNYAVHPRCVYARFWMCSKVSSESDRTHVFFGLPVTTPTLSLPFA